jgi:hypothetical protein
MKYYKNGDDKVFAYEVDGSQDHIIPANQTPITEAEADALRTPVLTTAEVLERIKTECDRQDAKPFEYPAGFGVYYKVTSAIKETIDFCELSGCIDTDPLPVNNGCWDNVDGTISTPMTVAELKSLYIYGYGIPAHNYSNMKAHIAALMLLAGNENSSPEEIGNYDYSTGWR